MAPSGCSFTEWLLLLAVFTVTAGLASVITAPPISSIPLVFVADAAPMGGIDMSEACWECRGEVSVPAGLTG